jgi:hypothetical protein
VSLALLQTEQVRLDGIFFIARDGDDLNVEGDRFENKLKVDIVISRGITTLGHRCATCQPLRVLPVNSLRLGCLSCLGLTTTTMRRPQVNAAVGTTLNALKTIDIPYVGRLVDITLHIYNTAQVGSPDLYPAHE